MLEILAAIPFGAVLRPLSLIPPLVWAADLLYGLIAGNRDVLGRLMGLEGSCDVPPPDEV